MITDQSYYLIDASKLTPNPITIVASGKEARGLNRMGGMIGAI